MAPFRMFFTAPVFEHALVLLMGVKRAAQDALIC